MNVTVSVGGRFHAFHLARQLERSGTLQRLITTHPKFAARKFGIPGGKITSFSALEVARRSWERIPSAVPGRSVGHVAFHEAFDHLASRHVPADVDLYVGWSGFSERGLRVAREAEAVTLVERGSTHIETQRDTLAEEYARLGMHGELPLPSVVAKEVREYELADYVCVPSKIAQESFIARGFPAHRVLRVPYGVDLELFSPARKRDLTFRVLFVGSISLRKGIQYLLPAWDDLRVPRSELVLLGAPSPECVPLLGAFAGAFRHVRPVSVTRLRDHLTQASVFVLCSVEDGFGLVLAQAMACGLPVICSSNVGGSDMIRDGTEGFVVPTRDVEALQDRLAVLHRDPDLREAMGQAARRRILEAFTWDDYGRRVNDTYDAIFGKGGTARHSTKSAVP